MKALRVHESLNFKRGQHPYDALDIGDEHSFNGYPIRNPQDGHKIKKLVTDTKELLSTNDLYAFMDWGMSEWIIDIKRIRLPGVNDKYVFMTTDMYDHFTIEFTKDELEDEIKDQSFAIME